MSLSGQLFIGTERVSSTETFQATHATTGVQLEPRFSVADPGAVNRACELAWSAFDTFRALAGEARARFLEAIAHRILALGDELLERAHAETALPLARLTNERARTVAQLRLFATELRQYDWQGVRVDPPRLQQRKIPLGPVVVFGASNFPLAFSVAGGDTAAAFAAGCPVIVKGHPAHPGTSELVAQAIVAAVSECQLPPGVFSLLNGESYTLGAALVAHPRVKAVGFTGSRAGGLALMRIANARTEPIPVYAEMSSVNPVLLLPGALAARGEKLAQEFVASLNLGVGQFCTNPGVLLALEGLDLERFILATGTALAQVPPGVMLSTAIQQAYNKGVARLRQAERVRLLAQGTQSAFFAIAAQDLIHHPEALEEVFGPASVLIRCQSESQLAAVLEGLEGQLTATLHLAASDEPLAARLVPILERKAGRLVANGWPTGVEVSRAMVHGGPFPATSEGRSTSVGTLAMERFLRPVCYQDFPQGLLPSPLRSA